jgi:hypothetical protein
VGYSLHSWLLEISEDEGSTDTRAYGDARLRPEAFEGARSEAENFRLDLKCAWSERVSD